MLRIVSIIVLLVIVIGCASHPTDPNAPVTSSGKIAAEPVAAVKSVLPEGWRIYRVEENSFPFYRRAGNGKAIRLIAKNHHSNKGDFDAIVYIMPADYDDGGADLTRGETETIPPTLVATAANGKIYLWGAPEDWPTMRDDVLRVLIEGKPH